MTGEQIFVTAAFALLVPLAGIHWYMLQRQSKRKKRPSPEMPKNS